MEWIGVGLLIPVLMCGLMMVAGVVAAVFGFRRAGRDQEPQP